MAKIVHIEFAGVDGAALKHFYEALFGWSIASRDVLGLDYLDVEVEVDATVAIRPEPEGPAEIVVYVEVDALEESVEKAVVLGASVRIPPMTAGDMRFALIADPEGNPVGLIQA